jgi:hypothetical protein
MRARLPQVRATRDALLAIATELHYRPVRAECGGGEATSRAARGVQAGPVGLEAGAQDLAEATLPTRPLSTRSRPGARWLAPPTRGRGCPRTRCPVTITGSSPGPRGVGAPGRLPEPAPPARLTARAAGGGALSPTEDCCSWWPSRWRRWTAPACSRRDPTISDQHVNILSASVTTTRTGPRQPVHVRNGRTGSTWVTSSAPSGDRRCHDVTDHQLARHRQRSAFQPGAAGGDGPGGPRGRAVSPAWPARRFRLASAVRICSGAPWPGQLSGERRHRVLGLVRTVSIRRRPCPAGRVPHGDRPALPQRSDGAQAARAARTLVTGTSLPPPAARTSLARARAARSLAENTLTARRRIGPGRPELAPEPSSVRPARPPPPGPHRSRYAAAVGPRPVDPASASASTTSFSLWTGFPRSSSSPAK